MNPYEAPQTAKNRTPAEAQLPRADFHSPRQQRNPGAVLSASLLFAVILLVVNVLIIFYIAVTDGWNALGFVIVIVPVLNLGAGIVGLLMLPGVNKAAAGSSTALYLATIVILPFLAIAFDVLLFKKMGH
jgi:hypothetical protein